MLPIRISKVALTAAAGAFCLLVGYNNIVDYGSNLMFVQHVLAMDTVFPDNAVRASRAISDPRLHHLAYWFIILAELVIGLLCAVGAARLAGARKAPASVFNQAKSLAVLGLAAAVAFWFTAFLVVGAEWFQMWQSQTWNGQEGAFRFIGSIGLMLIFVSLEDKDAV